MDNQQPKGNKFLKNLFSEDEFKELVKQVSHDRHVIPALKIIFKARLREVGRRDDLLDDPNYAIKRAYLDGRNKELAWLINQIEALEKGGSDK